LEATQAISFFIRLSSFRAPSVQTLTLENSQTREKLVIKGETETQGYDSVSISRYPLGTNEDEWIKEMKQRPNMDSRKIEFI
jgi:hypothetical protein